MTDRDARPSTESPRSAGLLRRQAAQPRRNRPVVAAVLGLVLTASLSGCGVLPLAMRTVTVVDAISFIEEIIESAPHRQPRTTVGVRASVDGTAGSGLWLNGRPGAERLRVLPEGTSVTLLCSTSGPNVTGPDGATAIWQFSQTPEGATGFLSAAYLETDSEEALPPLC